jgi:hypothetical protein
MSGLSYESLFPGEVVRVEAAVRNALPDGLRLALGDAHCAEVAASATDYADLIGRLGLVARGVVSVLGNTPISVWRPSDGIDLGVPEIGLEVVNAGETTGVTGLQYVVPQDTPQQEILRFLMAEGLSASIGTCRRDGRVIKAGIDRALPPITVRFGHTAFDELLATL